MPDPLPALVDDRSALLRQIAELGDFQPGSITSATRPVVALLAIALNPMTLGTVPILNSPRKSTAKQ